MWDFLRRLFTPPTLYVSLGTIFLLLAVIGGLSSSYFVLSTIAHPRFAGVIGFALVVLGIFLGERNGHHSADVIGVESLDCSQPYRSVDPANRQPTTLLFVNESPKALKAFWVSTSGEQELLFALPPRQSWLQETFAGHVWVLKDGDDKCVAVFRSALPRAVVRGKG